MNFPNYLSIIKRDEIMMNEIPLLLATKINLPLFIKSINQCLMTKRELSLIEFTIR